MIITIEIANNTLGMVSAALIALLLFAYWIKLYNADKLKGVKFYFPPLVVLAILLAAMIKFMP